MFVDGLPAPVRDVYVEKPLSLTVSEGRRMVEVALRNEACDAGRGPTAGRGRSYRQAADFIAGGGIGKVTMARSFAIRNEWPLGLGKANGPGSLGLGVGPLGWGRRPYVKYDPNRQYYNFRWFYDYSGGQLTNFGVHFVDAIRWIVGLGVPRSVAAMGGRYADIEDNREIPDTMQVMWEFDPSVLVVFTLSNGNGAPGDLKNSEIEIRGTKGTMYIRNSRWEVVPEAISDTVTGFRSRERVRQSGETGRGRSVPSASR